MSDTSRTDALWDNQPFGRPFLSEVRKFARQLERELAEAKDQRDAAIWCHEKCREDRLRVIAQRDRLAEALESVFEEIGDAYLACESEVREALAAVKGGTP